MNSSFGTTVVVVSAGSLTSPVFKCDSVCMMFPVQGSLSSNFVEQQCCLSSSKGAVAYHEVLVQQYSACLHLIWAYG